MAKRVAVSVAQSNQTAQVQAQPKLDEAPADVAKRNIAVARGEENPRMRRAIELEDMRLLCLIRASGTEGTTQRELQLLVKRDGCPKPIINALGELINAECVYVAESAEVDERPIDRKLYITRVGINVIESNRVAFADLVAKFDFKSVPVPAVPSAPKDDDDDDDET